MILLKDTVKMKDLRDEMLLALKEVDKVFDLLNADTIITSANDSKHRNGSKHYLGLAYDFRIKHVPMSKWGWLKDEVAKRLGADYVVLLEDPSTVNAHLHVQFGAGDELPHPVEKVK